MGKGTLKSNKGPLGASCAKQLRVELPGLKKGAETRKIVHTLPCTGYSFHPRHHMGVPQYHRGTL